MYIQQSYLEPLGKGMQIVRMGSIDHPHCCVWTGATTSGFRMIGGGPASELKDGGHSRKWLQRRVQTCPSRCRTWPKSRLHSSTLLGPCTKAFRVATRRSNIASPSCLGFPACFLTTSCGILDERLQRHPGVFNFRHELRYPRQAPTAGWIFVLG